MRLDHIPPPLQPAAKEQPTELVRELLQPQATADDIPLRLPPGRITEQMLRDHVSDLAHAMRAMALQVEQNRVDAAKERVQLVEELAALRAEIRTMKQFSFAGLATVAFSSLSALIYGLWHIATGPR